MATIIHIKDYFDRYKEAEKFPKLSKKEQRTIISARAKKISPPIDWPTQEEIFPKLRAYLRRRKKK